MSEDVLAEVTGDLLSRGIEIFDLHVLVVDEYRLVERVEDLVEIIVGFRGHWARALKISEGVISQRIIRGYSECCNNFSNICPDGLNQASSG